MGWLSLEPLPGAALARAKIAQYIPLDVGYRGVLRAPLTFMSSSR